MREILFRGKQENTNEWVYGYLSKTRNVVGKLQICIDYEENGVMCSSIVFCDTVGQYTGLNDKKGVKIFEDDIVLYEDADADFEGYHDNVFLNRGKVIWSIWDGMCFTNRATVEMEDLYDIGNICDCEVIGNIHDNPELLAGERE